MHKIGIGFQPTNSPLNGDHITARGLHGVLYHVLKRADAHTATWLHKHSAPKPYTMVPYYDTKRGILAGIRITAVTDRTAGVLLNAWQRAYKEQWPLHLGRISFIVRDIENIPGDNFEQHINAPADPTVGLRFMAPTAFRQGPGHLPLPLPRNVFSWPWRVWDAFAPSTLRLPPDWLDWCNTNVFVVQHDIQTAAVTIRHNEQPFVGFVGDVWFQAYANELLYLSTLQALARLTTYSGVGYKTTMGMGAVELLS